MSCVPEIYSQRAVGNLYAGIGGDTAPLIYVTTDYLFQGWLEISIVKPNNKSSWLKKSSIKQWKWRFAVLVRPLEGSERVALELYEKNENWSAQRPKKSIDMYPKYKVSKKGEFKGKEHVFQISNEEETCYLAAESQKSMDLWVIQIQMQTKLSRSISGRIFSVMPCKTRPLQRIGARDQRCLLHFTRWGLTLALQDSRSILAMWPLSTIRNYECTGSGNFTFESGRKAPMGTGFYSFGALKGDDEAMFNVIDAFVNARLNARAEIGPKRREEETTDEEVLATYDKLHSCALGFLPHDVTPGMDDYAIIGPPLPSDPEFMISDPPPPYDHLASIGLIRSVSQNSGNIEDDLNSCPPSSRNASFTGSTSQSYDQLNRTRSWGTKSETNDLSQERLSHSVASMKVRDAYDHIDWAGTSGPQRFQSQSSFGTLGQQLANEPSVPNIFDGVNQETTNSQRRRLTPQQSGTSDPFVYTNAIYTPKTEFKARPKENATSPIAGNGIKQKRSSGMGPRPGELQFGSLPSPEADAYVPQLYPVTVPAKLDYQNTAAASLDSSEPGKRTSLLSQEIETGELLPYQNLGFESTAGNDSKNVEARPEDPELPARSRESIRFVPVQ